MSNINVMRRLRCFWAVLSFVTLGMVQVFAEGTKQLMPNSSDRLWLEFNVFQTGNQDFAGYDCPAQKRLNIRAKAGEKVFFGFKMNTVNYGGNVNTDPARVRFRIKRPDGTVIYAETAMPTSGSGYISTYAQAIAGPNGAKLNGVTITSGYTPLSFTANVTGDYYIEFRHLDNKRWALEFFDITVTDASNNIITNPGEPNKPAGRLWSKSWQLTTTSYTEYPVNNYFYVFTSDDFVNKINFKYYPFSFKFQSNAYGIIPTATEPNYIKRAQSKDNDQTANAMEYRVYLNDPDRGVWPTTRLAPPKIQVWAEDTLFYDYDYMRNPMQLPVSDYDVYLEKNRVGCPYSSVAIFKIEMNIDAFVAILIDIDGNGYSTSGSDRVIYRDLKKGINYILWDFKNDAGAEVPVGTYNASATFMGRGPTNFPVYDVEQCDGVITYSVRPFRKLNSTIYWDDTYITRWGDETGQGLMDDTQRTQLTIGANVPRIWSWNPALESINFNGNRNTLNTWFNAIDLGYSNIKIHVTQSTTKCINGLAPWVGDIYKEAALNTKITFTQEDFTKKFFDPTGVALKEIRITSLPTNGTLKEGATTISTVPYTVSAANLANLTFTPNAGWWGRTYFNYEGRNNNNLYSNNQEKVYLTINTPPTITPPTDQSVCTNSTPSQLNFTVSDGSQTPANDIVVTAYSHDPNFVLNGNLELGGSGSSRWVKVTPVANKSGHAIIYLMADDGYSQTIAEFAVYVGPDLEFTGDTTLCVGQDLYLVAQEQGASYTWKYGATTIATTQTLIQTWAQVQSQLGQWSLTVSKDGCNSTRYFTISVSPNTSFTGDVNVCVGEEINLSAVENNATYEWKKGTTVVSTSKQFYKASAVLADAGTNYTLKVTKASCEATSAPFTISVINPPSTGLTVSGSTVDPGHDGTITVNATQSGITYNVYKNDVYITSEVGTGGNINITVPAANLEVGNNIFVVKASNSNCEIPLTNTATIVVREPGFIISAISGNTTEAGGTATFTVRLKTQPTANVTLPISSSDLTEGTVSPATLTFTSANWSTNQTVTITGVDDYIIDGNVPYTIVIGPSSSTDPYYNNVDPADINLLNVDNDVAGVNITPTSGLTTTEAGGTATFTMRLTAQPAASVTITLSSSNPSEGTVSPASVTFTTANWNVNQTVTVTGVDDYIDDGDVVYTIITSNTSSTDPLFNNINVPDVAVTNLNNDVAGILVNPTSGLTTTESGGQATFTIRLNSQPLNNVTIGLSSSNTAEGTVSPTSVVFTPANWDTPKNITITGVDDDIDDGNQPYTIVTAAAVSTDSKYNGLNPSDVSVVNVNDDVAGITVTPTSSLQTTEAGGTATFTIKLNTRPTSNISINLTTTKPAEGVASPTSLTFTPANWSTPQSVTITGQDEYVDDGDQAYSINGTASSSDGNYNGRNFSVSATNIDNDEAGIIVNPTIGLVTNESGGQATFTMALSSQPTANVTIGLSSSNTAEGTVAPASVTFTTGNWNIPQTITVTGVDDAIADGPQSYTIVTAAATSSDPLYNGINPTDVAVTNMDNDVAGVTVSPTTLTTNENGSPATFTIVLNTKPTANVTINITSNDTSEGTVSPASITFTTTDWNTPKTITVTPVNDDEDDGDITYTIVTSNASSDDPVYNNLNVPDVTVTNTNDDVAGITVNPTSGLSTTEAGGTATFTIRLNSKPTANVTINLSSSNTSEGTVSPASVTFTTSNWNTPQTITVTGVDDDIDDGNVTYTIVTSAVTSTDAKYNGLDPSDVTVVNLNNDTAGFTITPTSGLTTTEAGGTAQFTVKLNTKPTANVTISLTSSNPAEGSVSPTSLTFTPSNWNTPQSVTITGVDDDVDDDNVAYTIITNPASSTDGKYSGLNPVDVSVTNIDNDTAGFTVTPTSGLTTTEAGGTAQFTIKLNTRPTANVTIPISSSNTSEGTVNVSSVTFTPANWNVPQTVIITGVDDDIDDGNVAYTIVTGAASSTDTKYNGMNPSDVSVTNINNDTAGITVNPTTGLTTTEAGGTATFTIRLNSRPTANVTIGLSSSNTAEGTVSPTSVTITPANWNNPVTITVTGVDDLEDDGDVAYTIVTAAATSSDAKYNGINPSDVSVTNTNNDVAGVIVSPFNGLVTTEDGGQATFTIRLNTKPKANVTINLNSSNTDEGNILPTSVSFTTLNWNTPQTITITGVNDDVDDDDVAYFIVTQPCVSTDPKYNNLDPIDVSVTNRDNDVAGFVVSPTLVTITENGASAAVTFRLATKPTANVTFDLASDNTSKGTVSPASLTFTPANWNTEQTATITPVNNFIDDGDVTFTVSTSAATSTDNKYNGINPADIEVTCIDDDVAGITVSSISGNTREDGTTATFTIVLNSEPTDDVTIAIESSNTAEGTVSPASVTFTPANWNTPQTITVTGVDDASADGNQTYTIIIHPAVSADPLYNGIDPDDITLQNIDDDQAGVNVFPVSGLTTSEAGGTASFTMSLNSAPASDVTVTFVSSNVAEGTVSPASHIFNFNVGNWNTPVEVTLTGVDDDIEDGDVGYQISIAMSSGDGNYNNLPVDPVLATNLDDVTPRPVADNAATDEETPVNINVLENDKGLDKGVKSVTITTQPDSDKGSVQLNVDNTIRFTPVKTYNGAVVFNYRVTLNNDNWAETSVTVNVAKVNDTPFAVDDNRGTSVNTPRVVDVLVNDTGLEDGGITVSIEEQPNPAQGTAVANGDNTVTFTPASGYKGLATFKYKVCDIDNECSIANVTVNVRTENHIPVANDDAATTAKNTPKAINVLANDSGLDDGFGSIKIYSQPSNGNAVVNSNRTVTYTPNADFVGTDQFVYLLEDVDGDYDLATVTITVTEKPNSIPQANPDRRATSKNVAVKVDVLTNDTGLGDGVKSLAVISNPANGTYQVNATNDSITYTPNTGFVGTDVLRYQVCDIDDECSAADVTITVKDGINHVPVANKDSVSTLVNKPVSINVLANDSGLEDGFGSLEIYSAPEFGSVTVNANRTITYTPTYMFVGTETFYYLITDTDGDLAIGKVLVTVIDRPDYLPVANDDRRGCSFNQSVAVDVLFNDTGLDDVPVTVAITQNPAQGTATVNADNTVTFTPANGYIGQMTFKYSVTDVDGDSDDATVTINVKSGTNIVPVAVDDAATTKVNTPVIINVLANDRGLEDGFGSLYIYRQPEFGTVVVNANRTVTYTPTYMFVGTETFQYVIEDTDGDYSLATVTVTVLDKQNAIPIANDDFRGCSKNGSVTADVLFNDTGLDDEPVTVTISQEPAMGTALVNPDNTITYTPPTDFVGVSTFSYTVTDANGEFDDALVTITVKPGINHVPAAQNDNANTVVNTSVDINVLANDTGLEDGFGNLTIRTQPMFGTVQVNANRTVTYYPSYMFIGTDSFQYLIEDVDGDYSVATVTVEVTEKPDALPIANDDRVGCSFNQNRVIEVLFNDTGLDDEPVTVTISESPAQGNVVVNPDNTVTFTPANGFIGAVTFRYTVTDSDGDSDDAQVTVNVKAGTNYIPVANDDAASTFMNNPVSITVLANDTDLDDGFGNLYIYKQPQFGTVTVNANRTVTYTPSYMFVGVETFMYVVEDIDGDWDVATVTVSVTERPNAIPVANDDSRGCSFNQSRVVDVLFNDTGLEDTPITVTILESPAQGTVAVNPDNTITFTPASGYIGTMTFRYTVTDADNESDDALVTIRVKSGENYVPTANDDAATTTMNTAIDINVMANDTGLDDGFGDLRIYSQPQFGTVIINANRTIRYIPSNMFLGNDSFKYLIEDVDGDYSVATVTVNVVERINHTPVANDDYRGTAFETTRVIDVLFNDEGIEDIPLTVTLTVEPKNGSATVNLDNTVTYTPTNGFLGLDSLTYRVADIDGEWDEAKVFINVKPFNMIPEARDDYATTMVNTPVDINVLANDTLLFEGIKQVWIKVNPLYGTVTVNSDFTVTFTPSYFFIGNDEFTYVVEDVDGDYAMAKVYVTVVDRVNHIPVANDDRRATSKNTPVSVDVLINDDGLDDGWVTVHLKEQADPLTGTAMVNPDNTITFTPATDYLGLAIFKYFITDYNNDTSNVATVTVNVKEVNFVPTAVNDTAYTTMNVPLLVDVIANDKDLNDGVDYLQVMEKPRHGFAYAFDSKNIRYIPSSWFVGKDSLTYMVVDEDGDYGIAKVYITIGEREDNKPKANPDGRGTIINTPVNVDVLFNDTGLEDGGIKLLITQKPIHGNVLLEANNTVTYTPNTNYLGEDVFRYQVCDFDNDCSSANVVVKVKNSNLIPKALNDTVTTFKNRAIEFDPTFNDQNKGDGGIVAVIYTQPINGQAVSVNPARFRYTPAADFFGTDSLWYYIQDIDGDYSLAKIVVNVLNRENYTPDAQDDEAETYTNTSILIDVLANDLWLNDGVKTVEVAATPVNANAVVTADYKIQYTPLSGYKGTESFTYRVCDTDDECDIATVTVRAVTDPNRKVVIPEAFSPNGDNINDTFEVQNIEYYQKVTLHVYNRWGNLVYKSDGYKNDWDGTSNVSMAVGSKLPDGTYYYLLEIKDTGKVYKGSVYIKRSY